MQSGSIESEDEADDVVREVVEAERAELRQFVSELSPDNIKSGDGSRSFSPKP